MPDKNVPAERTFSLWNKLWTSKTPVEYKKMYQEIHFHLILLPTGYIEIKIFFFKLC